MENKYITVAYKLYSIEDGEREFTEEATVEHPFQFISGLGLTLDAFEEQIKGLNAGDKFDFTIACTDAYGEYDEDHVIDLPKDIFLIDDDVWEQAKKELQTVFQNSSKLESCLGLIRDFETINPKRRYKSDLELFIRESKLNDFFGESGETIFVSTIHKVKGMEFDNVFLMLDNFVCNDDEARRQLYVALTRAKNNLYIHTNTRLFSRIAARNMEVEMDMREYGKSPEMIMQLTLKDVWLDDFHCRQYAIDGLMSGDRLYVVGEGPAVMLADDKGRIVLQFSKKFKQEYGKVLEEGYRMDSAEVNMIVWWKNENREKEIKVLLPTLHFSFETWMHPY